MTDVQHIFAKYLFIYLFIYFDNLKIIFFRISIIEKISMQKIHLVWYIYNNNNNLMGIGFLTILTNITKSFLFFG